MFPDSSTSKNPPGVGVADTDAADAVRLAASTPAQCSDR